MEKLRRWPVVLGTGTGSALLGALASKPDTTGASPVWAVAIVAVVIIFVVSALVLLITGSNKRTRNATKLVRSIQGGGDEQHQG